MLILKLVCCCNSSHDPQLNFSISRKFAKNAFSQVLKSVGWGLVGVWQCRTPFWIPSMYLFKWCKYKDHTFNSWWDICFQTKRSLVSFQSPGKILTVNFSDSLQIYRKFCWKFYLFYCWSCFLQCKISGKTSSKCCKLA